MLTFGTGLGSALFDDGRSPRTWSCRTPRTPGSAPYDDQIGELKRQADRQPKWSRRVAAVVDGLRPVFHWDRLYLGGGNAAQLIVRRLECRPDVTIVPNTGRGARRLPRLETLIG